MLHNLRNRFGVPARRVDNAIHSLQAKSGVILIDDEDRKAEGELIFNASTMTVEQMALMIRECSGIVRLALPLAKVENLGLPPMVEENTSKYQSAFTDSIEAARGVTTGVSAHDRLATIRAAIREDAVPEDLRRPGHIFPIQACSGGVLERPGHTEAAVDLMRLAGLSPFGVLSEVTNPDGTMAKLDELMDFGEKNLFPIVTVQDLIEWRNDHPE